MCCILRIGQVDDLQCLHRAAHYTNRQFALVYALVAHFTFGDLTEVFVEAGDAIRTCHRTEFAADAAFVVMCDDTVVTLGIGTGGTRLQTGGVITVVAGEGYADPAGLGEILFLHVVDLAPMDAFTTDFLTKKKKLNEGEIPQYYVTGNHEAIIEPEVFDMVQRELVRRGKGRNRHSGVHAFSGKIKCGTRGSWFGSKVWHSNDKYRRIIWQCNYKFDGEKCPTPHVGDKTIESAFIKAINILIAEKETVLTDYDVIKDMLFSTEGLEKERAEIQQEINVVSKMIQDAIGENSRIAIDQTAFQSRYESLVQRFDTAKAKYDAVCAEIDDKRNRRTIMEQFIKTLTKCDNLLIEFETEMWHALVDFVTVYTADDIRITFKNGKEIRA